MNFEQIVQHDVGKVFSKTTTFPLQSFQLNFEYNIYDPPKLIRFITWQVQDFSRLSFWKVENFNFFWCDPHYQK